MARITVEDCLEKVKTRFVLTHLAAKRVRQLKKGAKPLVKCKNENIVLSLREIAEGKVFPVKRKDNKDLIKERAESAPVEIPGQTDLELPDQKEKEEIESVFLEESQGVKNDTELLPREENHGEKDETEALEGN
ncbi:MAG: DNA-directed RNA polymerase subunit omega [Deltaproteobacteria bacterium]|nr:DNA-directed RNA polymerase subunit omega [Deltaproteobacteria bacterium]